MARSRTWVPKVAGVLALAACGGGVAAQSPDGGDDGGAADGALLPDGGSVDVTTGSSGSSGGFGSSSGSGGSGSSGGPGSSGSSGSSSGGASSSGGSYVDAGLYYGDGSFWVDGGAYPPEEAGADAPTDASTADASTPCGALANCCPTLSGGSQTLCNSVVAAGDQNNCTAELSQLESEGDCLGEMVLVSNNQVPPNRLASDGNLLFWTSSAGLFAVPVQGGAVTTLVSAPSGGIAAFLAVDDLNVYVLLEPGLVRIPKSGASPTLMSDPGAPVVSATSLGSTAYWIEAIGYDAGAGQTNVESAPLQGNGINPVATGIPQGWNYGLIGVTSNTVFLGANGGDVSSFPLGGPGNPALVGGTMNDNCMTLTSDTAAIYCANSSGDNVSVASSGTVSRPPARRSTRRASWRTTRPSSTGWTRSRSAPSRRPRRLAAARRSS